MGAATIAAGFVLAFALLAAGAIRERRRRRRLRCALHELRRPLQILLLAHPDTESGGLADQLRGALAELERAIDGTAPDLVRRESLTLAGIAADAAARWRHVDAVEVRVPDAAAAVEADPVRVGSALDNMVANALEHGTAPVRVEAAVEAAEARIEVRDNGPARMAQTRAERRPGRRGHGLRIAGAIVAAHEGGLIEPRATLDGTLAGLTLRCSDDSGPP